MERVEEIFLRSSKSTPVSISRTGHRSTSIKKETLAQVFSCKFCEIYKNTFLTEYLLVAASFSELIISISISTTLLLCRKKRTSFKTLVSKKTTIWQLRKSHSNDKLWEKVTSSSYHMEQKHSSKEVASITYTLEKTIFSAATFKGF